MNKLNLRAFLSAVCVMSILAGFSRIDAAPVRFDQVVQIMNATPGKADSGSFSRLSLTNGGYDFLVTSDDDDDDDKKKKGAPPLPQDDRVITETRTDIVLDDDCECEEVIYERRGFPKWALLGLAAIPIALILIRRRRDRETPTPTPPTTPTPPHMTPTPPGMTPTPTPPHMTPTPTPPHMTPTPPPEPIPEPMTILLFGSGLASVGLAARRKFGKKGEQKDEKKEE